MSRTCLAIKKPTLAKRLETGSVDVDLIEAVKSRNLATVTELEQSDDRVNAELAEKVIHHVFHDADCNFELQGAIINIIRFFLCIGMNVNCKNNAGHTLLHLAIEIRMTDVIEFLISRGVDTKVRDRLGNTIAQFTFESEFQKWKKLSSALGADKKRAFREHSMRFIQWMVLKDFNADLNVRNDKGNTMLNSAIENRSTELIDFLIICGANWDLRDADGNTVLHYSIYSETRNSKKHKLSLTRKLAVEQESINFIEWMIRKRPEFVDCKNQVGETPVHLAAKSKLFHAIPTLLKYTKDVTIVNDSDKTAFQVFAESLSRAGPIRNYDDAEKALIKFLQAGFSVDVADVNDNTPLHYALHGRKWRCAELMLDYTKNVDARDERRNTPLNIIMNYSPDCWEDFRNIDEKIVRMLLKRGANIHKLNENSSSPLIGAVRKKKLNTLRIFKEHEEDFCYRYGRGNLLHYFLTSQHPVYVDVDKAVLDLLVGEGCDVNAKDEKGRTPLHLAVEFNKFEVVKKLVDSGALVDQRESSRGFTPLHLAVEHNHTNLLELLITSGCDVNATTYMGETALHLLSEGKAARTLIKSGAWVDVADKADFLPLHRAILQRNYQVIIDLLRFGADINDNTHVLRKKDYLRASACISEHMIKLRAAELPIDKKIECILTNPSIQREVENVSELHEGCLKEIEMLKSHKIDDGRSLYDFLHMNRNYASVCVKNTKNFDEFVDSSALKKQFPLCYELISSAYCMAAERREMLKSAKQAWLELTGIRLPDLCIHEILNHVSNVTLRTMIRGMNNGK